MFATWATSYLMPWLVTFVLMGIILQMLDRYIGVPLYRWYFNRGSGEDARMPQTVEMGFFHNQSLARQHKRALIFSATQSIATALATKMTFGELVAEVFVLVLEAWFLLPGLWLGERLYRIFQRQEKIFEAIDHRQEFAAGLMERAKTAAQGLWDAVRPKKAPPAASPTSPAPAKETPQNPPQEDSRAALKRSIEKYAGGSR